MERADQRIASLARKHKRAALMEAARVSFVAGVFARSMVVGGGLVVMVVVVVVVMVVVVTMVVIGGRGDGDGGDGVGHGYGHGHGVVMVMAMAVEEQIKALHTYLFRTLCTSKLILEFESQVYLHHIHVQ